MSKFLKILKDWWFPFLIACLAYIYISCFATAEVNGSSMFPTYEDGDFLLLYKTTDVDYGDIVAIDSTSLNKILCKRIIGLAGDNIVINKEGILRNGVLLEEPYISTSDWSINYDLDIVVDENSVFVMGDNRLHSTDSRDLGCLNMQAIRGVSIINFTSLCGLTRQRLGQITLLFWIICGLFLIFGKKRRSTKEG